jgi:predicted RND superfamily exporter protein
MINLKNAEKKVKQVDSLLTAVTNLIKKHWIFLIFLILLIITLLIINDNMNSANIEENNQIQQDTTNIINDDDTSSYESDTLQYELNENLD